MVSANLSISVASLSDLLARYVAIARNTSEFAPIRTSKLYEDYYRMKCQLEKLQRICQKYSPLSVKFCAAHADPADVAENLLAEALRLAEIAERFYKGSIVSPWKANESLLFPSDFGITRSESGHLSGNEKGSEPTILVYCVGEHESARQLLSSLPCILGRCHRQVDVQGVVFASKSSRSSYLETHVPIIFISYGNSWMHSRPDVPNDTGDLRYIPEPAFPYFSPTSEHVILDVNCSNVEELYDCIAWSIHLLAQTDTSIAKPSKSSYVALRCRPLWIKNPMSGCAHGIDHTIRGLDSCRRWWSALALFWIAFAGRKLDGTELLSALAAAGRDHFPVHSDLFAGQIGGAGDLSEIELTAILRESLIISKDGKILLSNEEAKTALLHLVSDPGGTDEASIHEMIAYTCLCCIERYQPASILRPWTVIESYLDHQSTSSNLLLYAASQWHVHFRLGERRSRRLSALLHRIIQSALSTNKINGRSHHPSSMQVINTGMWLCAFYDFKSLGNTYIQMGAELTGVSGAGTCPIHVAASKANLGMLELLLKRQPELSATDREGMTPLQVAVSHGHVAAVEMLLAAGSNVNDIFVASRVSALHIAVRGGYKKIVALLLERGAEIDAKNVLSESSLYIALRTSKLAIAKMLIDKGASYPPFSTMDESITEAIDALRNLSFVERDASSARESPQYVLQEPARLEIHLGYCWDG